MPANGQGPEQRRLAREVVELLDSVGDSTNLSGNELVQFDMRRNEILEDMAPLVRRLTDLVLREPDEP